MMNFIGKFIAIPEIDFTDYGDIMDTTYDNYSNNNIRIVFNMGTKEMYDRLLNGLLESNNHLNELMVFDNQYEDIKVYNNLTVSNLEMSLNESNSFRNRSGHGFGGQIQNYQLDVTFGFKDYYKTKARLFDRYKKLQNIIKKIKENESH